MRNKLLGMVLIVIAIDLSMALFGYGGTTSQILSFVQEPSFFHPFVLSFLAVIAVGIGTAALTKTDIGVRVSIAGILLVPGYSIIKLFQLIVSTQLVGDFTVVIGTLIAGIIGIMYIFELIKYVTPHS